MSNNQSQSLRQYSKQGWNVENTNGGHIRLTHPDAQHPVFTSKTPSDHRTIHNLDAQLRRALRANSISSGDLPVANDQGVKKKSLRTRSAPERKAYFQMPDRSQEFADNKIEQEPSEYADWRVDPDFSRGELIAAWTFHTLKLRLEGREVSMINILRNRFRDELAYRDVLIGNLREAPSGYPDMLRQEHRVRATGQGRVHRPLGLPKARTAQELDKTASGPPQVRQTDDLGQRLTVMEEALAAEQRKYNALRQSSQQEISARDRMIIDLRVSRSAQPIQSSASTSEETPVLVRSETQPIDYEIKDSGYRKRWRQAQAALSIVEQQSASLQDRLRAAENRNLQLDNQISALTEQYKRELCELREQLSSTLKANAELLNADTMRQRAARDAAAQATKPMTLAKARIDGKIERSRQQTLFDLRRDIGKAAYTDKPPTQTKGASAPIAKPTPSKVLQTLRPPMRITGKTVGARLANARKQLDWSRAQMAAEVGVSTVAILFWENDKHVPKEDSIERIISALGVTRKSLLLAEPPPQKGKKR